MTIAEVITLRGSTLADVPAMLRKLADDIEADEKPCDMAVTVCSRNGELDVRGLGSDGGLTASHVLLGLAMRHLEDCALERIRGER